MVAIATECLQAFSVRPALPIAAAVALLLAGCQTPRVEHRPAASPERPASPTSVDALASRPLYTLSESELGVYLGAIRRNRPELQSRVIALARQNLGQPYEIYLLGEFPYELYDPDPIYCLSRSDCLTFAEHMYAMALGRDWWSFLAALQRLRYKDGEIGMLTRNHYTEADWNRNNAAFFEDKTPTLGGGTASIALRAMVRRAHFFAKFGIGQDVPDETITDQYIPTANVPSILSELRDGDLVNIVRGDRDSQWVGHVGFVAIGDNGTVNFLHSASPAVREQPLTGYLATNERCLGIKILRPRANAQEKMDDWVRHPVTPTPVNEARLREALAAAPLQPTGAPAWYSQDWARAMRLQSYRLEHDTPVDDALQAQLEAIDRTVAERLGIPAEQRAIGLMDLDDGRFAAMRADQMFYGASVPKICIVAAYFEADPQAAINLSPDVERELQLVLKRSDNELAGKYSQIVGLQRIQAFQQSPAYRFYDREHGGGLWSGKHYGIDQPRTGEPIADHSHAATVRQCLRYYLMLEQGRLVSAAASARIKQLMAAPELEFHKDCFVRGLCGRDVTVLRKNGEWEDWWLDTARIQHGDRLYLMAGMVRNPRGEEYLAQMASAVDEILCGASPARPFEHRLILNDAPADESPPIDTDIHFNEAVVSWNADCPAGAGFAVEIRVGRRCDGFWSPYLHVGEWGDAPPDGDRVTKFESGMIDVDYFRSPERFDRIQYRIRRSGNAESAVVRRVAICVSDLTGLPASTLAAASAARRSPSLQVDGARRRLPVPFRSQKSESRELAGKICSPTSVAMVLAYHGAARATMDVARACFDPASDIYGNWPRNIQGAYSLGLPGYASRFSEWTEVERLIAAGQPLVISIRVERPGGLRGAPYNATDGHLLVLCGFNAAGDVEVNDPAAAEGRGELTYRRAELEECWMHAAGGLAYVFERP